MVFSSVAFLFVYLPVALAGYFLLPRKARLLFLFLISLLFYGWGEPVYVFLMVFSIAMNWGAGFLIGRRPARKKAVLVAAVVLNLALLGVFKYTGFVVGTLSALIPALSGLSVPEVKLPIGISFYTFQAMSYVIDVYRGDAEAQRSPVAFGAYVTLFPQLIAGPIVRYKDIAGQLTDREESLAKFYRGLRQFIIGLSKKLLLANAMGQMWNAIVGMNGQSGILGGWAGLLAYAFQIYFDFSGYSDMACGLGRMMGFEFVNNFNYPYSARSITDFWRRWHISLSTWFREYVYIPLGGNRKGLPRQLLNIAVVWLLTGLWHGASWNFVLWGGYFALLLIVEKAFLLKWLERAPRWIGHVYAMVLVALSWAVFAITDFSALGVFMRSLFVPGGAGWIAPEAAAWAAGFLPWMALCAVACLPVGKMLYERCKGWRAMPAIEFAACAILLLLCVAALARQSYNPFIYFRF